MTVATRADQDFDRWAGFYRAWSDLAGDQDLAYYRELAAAAPRPLVDLGIGLGRLAVHLRPDVGIDIAPRMVAESRRRLGSGTEVRVAGIASYTLARPAGLSYAAQNTLNHVDIDELPQVMANVFRNTVPGGRFGFETAVPEPARLRMRDRLPVLRAWSPRLAVYDITRLVDPERHRVEIIGCLERLDRRGRAVERRYFPPIGFTFLPVDLVRRLAVAAGWEVEQLHGDYAGATSPDGSGRAVWCLRRPGNGA